MGTVYVYKNSEVSDPAISSAYQSALYVAENHTGNFRKSKGYVILKQTAYAIQRADKNATKHKKAPVIISE